MFPSIRYLGNTKQPTIPYIYNMSGHLPLLLVNPLKAQLTKTFFQKYRWSHNWQGPFNVFKYDGCDINSNIYMTSILLTFAVPIHMFSTFFIRERDITSRHPFSFHDSKNISYVLFCDNCTPLVIGPSMRIFPLAQSIHLLFERNKIQYIRK